MRMKPDRFYSKLGESFKPGVLTEVVLAAFELAKKGVKLISLTGGSYDPNSFAVEPIRDIFADASSDEWREMLQYGSNMGSMKLRFELSRFMTQAGIKVDPKDEIIVTTGSQQALDLISRIFIDEGDIIIVGEPTYLQALSAFKQFNPRFKVVSLDSCGLDTDALKIELSTLEKEGKNPKFIYLVPSFDNPTGTLMSKDRRITLIELAEEFDFLIIEDNPYGYISFEGPMPTPIKAYDKTGRTLYLSTFSKIVSPGLRIGWVAAHKEFISKMAEAKSNVDICSDGLSQFLAVELLRKNIVEKQIGYITSIYRRKRDVILESMNTSFPKQAEWNEPKGGLFLWVKMPEKINTTDLLKEAVNKGVAYIPGSNFFLDPNINNYLRLNYSFPSTEDIVEGVSILGKLFKNKLQE
ncbi:MAG: aminotransferase-like domain-containing protein [Candidatus Bathyarchaeia archaeon]